MIELTNKLASAERCIEIAEEQLKEHEGVDDNLANMIAKMRVQTQNEFQRYQSEAEAAFQSAVSEFLNPFVTNAPFLYSLKTSGDRESVHWEQMGQ